MVVDTSALVAILRKESEAEGFLDVLGSAASRLVAAPTLVEASIVMLARFGEAGLSDLDALIDKMDIAAVPFTGEQAAFAIDAFRRYGKARHPAGLNFGDCFSYALARATDQPLLFKGEDFARTDVRQIAGPPATS